MGMMLHRHKTVKGETIKNVVEPKKVVVEKEMKVEKPTKTKK